MMKWPLNGIVWLALSALSACQLASQQVTPVPIEPAFIDTHAHLNARHREDGHLAGNHAGAIEIAIANSRQTGARFSLLAPPPFPADHPAPYDFKSVKAAALLEPAKFGFIGGGWRLNAFIHQHAGTVRPAPEVFSELDRRADEISGSGGRAFGELTVLHLSFQPWHPFLEIMPDHPLLLALADRAAAAGLPIDLHMEAVSEDMVTPERFLRRSANNPRVLKENIRAFKRLLRHNPGAKIIWAHAGWDNTGHRSVGLMARLLAEHPNLYMAIKIGLGPFMPNRPLDFGGIIRPDWIGLIEAFPDRFVIGSDNFHTAPDAGRQFPQILPEIASFVRQLPPLLARQVGLENPVRIFNLPAALAN